MNLKIERPIVFYDVETTGIDPNTARIVELAGIKLMPNGDEIEFHQRYNPGIPIPIEASSVHGITDEDVKDEISFDEGVNAVLEFFDDSDIAGYNSNRYDNLVMANQLEEQGYAFPAGNANFIDALVIFTRQEGRKLSDAYKFYTGKELVNAHSAQADIRATIEVFKKQIDMYKELPDTMEELALYCNYDKKPAIDREGKFVYNDFGQPVFNFGKHKGIACSEEPSYLVWIETANNTFSEHIKSIAKNIRIGKYNNTNPN